MTGTADIGIVGLGVMGENLAINMESQGFSVVGFDLDESKRASFAHRTQGKRALAAESPEAFVAALARPRRIFMMVPAGRAVDAVIATFRPHLQPGDVFIDGGNTHFTDTERRIRELEASGILFIGSGVSGGEEGALKGPSIMPGGNASAWPLVKPILQGIAARTPNGEICCDWIGSGGSGHFVKMVHNGIEYGDMQMICEAYALMDRLLGLSADEIADVFTAWNQGELDSYLVDITAAVLRQKDEATGRPLVDVILDVAGQKGTGKWTSQVALDLGSPAQTIVEAVFVRMISGLKEERERAARIFPNPGLQVSLDRTVFIEQIRQALYASKICSYAQGFQMLRAADETYGWGLDLGGISQLWRAGCIIRAAFLGRIKEAFDRDPALANLLLDPFFADALNQAQAAWRSVISTAILSGTAVPAMTSALTYFDSYRSERLPANLLQAQRDAFGAHRYERVDAPRGQFFHTDWGLGNR
jgi:6-phosphogluconate dehydrogenase